MAFCCLQYIKMLVSIRKLLLASLLAVSDTTAQITGNTSSPGYFENLERYWSYGRSPPVYPSRKPSFSSHAGDF